MAYGINVGIFYAISTLLSQIIGQYYKVGCWLVDFEQTFIFMLLPSVALRSQTILNRFLPVFFGKIVN